MDRVLDIVFGLFSGLDQSSRLGLSDIVAISGGLG